MMSPTNDMVSLTNGAADLAIRDVQQRLEILGYDLGDEIEAGQYGEKTAAAVSAFKMRTHLPAGEMLDQATWIALVDASLTMGERILYLHRPHFQGRDVLMLQLALAALGFACNTDGIFDPTTECAVRDFQRSMAISDTGIVSEETITAIRRLRHAWESKGGARLEGRIPRFCRSLEVLETQPICIYGTTKLTRSTADRISNLAHATTSDAKVMSASSLSRAPGRDAVIVGLLQEDSADQCEKETFKELIGAALSAAQDERRVTINITPLLGNLAPQLIEQHCAVVILDTLCDLL